MRRELTLEERLVQFLEWLSETRGYGFTEDIEALAEDYVNE